ncbi:hypothetical protein B0H11DRAFT_2220145 [Mycena galericulata]|nr:hypothetical protein B0H11DRAFT_2220145 [Mycena galericulata]
MSALEPTKLKSTFSHSHVIFAFFLLIFNLKNFGQLLCSSYRENSPRAPEGRVLLEVALEVHVLSGLALLAILVAAQLAASVAAAHATSKRGFGLAERVRLGLRIFSVWSGGARVCADDKPRRNRELQSISPTSHPPRPRSASSPLATRYPLEHYIIVLWNDDKHLFEEIPLRRD